MNDIYLKIKSIRLEKKLTQEDVSKRLGMAQSNYARMERGLSQITVERLAELAEVFEMTPEAILIYSENQIDFKEDAQYYFSQVKKLEAKVQKLEKEILAHEEGDSYSYERAETEKKKLDEKVKEQKKQLALKDEIIQDKEMIIERLEREIEEKKNSIDHLQKANMKLLEMLSK